MKGFGFAEICIFIVFQEKWQVLSPSPIPRYHEIRTYDLHNVDFEKNSCYFLQGDVKITLIMLVNFVLHA